MRRLLVGTAIVVALSLFSSTSAYALGFTVGSPSLVSTTARSSQDSNHDGSHDLKCGSGKYMARIAGAYGSWGTYPAIEQLWFYCQTFGATPASVRWGTVEPTGAFVPWDDDTCTGTYPAVTGIRVNFDRYVKDIKLRCGDVSSSGRSITNRFNHDWLFDHVETNDTQTNLSCPANQVLTGARIRYREDADETSFTGLQIFCAAITPA